MQRVSSSRPAVSHTAVSTADQSLFLYRLSHAETKYNYRLPVLPYKESCREGPGIRTEILNSSRHIHKKKHRQHSNLRGILGLRPS